MGLPIRGAPPAEDFAPECLDPLTPREQAVLLLLARGYGNREIAAHLGLAVGTVKNHVSNILSKLGERRRTRVAVRAAKALFGHTNSEW